MTTTDRSTDNQRDEAYLAWFKEHDFASFDDCQRAWHAACEWMRSRQSPQAESQGSEQDLMDEIDAVVADESSGGSGAVAVAWGVFGDGEFVDAFRTREEANELANEEAELDGNARAEGIEADSALIVRPLIVQEPNAEKLFRQAIQRDAARLAPAERMACDLLREATQAIRSPPPRGIEGLEYIDDLLTRLHAFLAAPSPPAAKAEPSAEAVGQMPINTTMEGELLAEALVALRVAADDLKALATTGNDYALKAYQSAVGKLKRIDGQRENPQSRSQARRLAIQGEPGGED